MAFELTVGLMVADQDLYTQYRAEMGPLLESVGGRFRYDFDVSRTLKSEVTHEINRVFVLSFPDRASRQRFFSDPRYVEIRGRLFDKAVAATSYIAEYER
jgi:uncharacterized protein (DUF1330 family)